MLERFTSGYHHVLRYLGVDQPSASPADPVAEAEHAAVLELLVATMLADGTVADLELVAINEYGERNGWNTPTFSFTQALGSATAKVRGAREQGALADLLASASARITTPELRNEVPHACRLAAAADGETVETESAWLADVAAAFRG